ncbi:methyltransferase family protein [Luteimonas sp. e5]
MSRWFEHRIPPPVIDVAMAVLMWGLAAWWPQAQLWPRGGGWLVWLAACALAVAGGVVALAGAREFARAGTTLNPLAPERAHQLVTRGIFRHTRNPMYLGMLLVLAGWGVWLGNAVAFLGLPLMVITLNRLQIKPEEHILRERFGEVYERYAARVRRWI